jgi:hypothetical protein
MDGKPSVVSPRNNRGANAHKGEVKRTFFHGEPARSREALQRGPRGQRVASDRFEEIGWQAVFCNIAFPPSGLGTDPNLSL